MKKLIGLMIVGSLLLTVVPALAEDNTASSAQPPVNPIGAKHEKAKPKREAAIQKLEVDITGLTKKEAIVKVKAAVEERNVENQAKVQAKLETTAQKLGVNITGLTKKEAIIKLKAAAEAKKAESLAKVRTNVEAAAEKLGVDIKGLEINDAKAKVKEAAKIKEAVKAKKAAN